MKTRNFAPYAIAVAILVVGLAFAGVSVSTLLVVLLALTCPLMMLFMMTGMHGGDGPDQSGPRAGEQHDARTKH